MDKRASRTLCGKAEPRAINAAADGSVGPGVGWRTLYVSCCRVGNSRVVIVEDEQAVGQMAAQFVATRIIRNPHLVIALPTGKTPLPMYDALARRTLPQTAESRRARLDFSHIQVFNLDEVYGLSARHPSSYSSYLRREFLSRVNISPRGTHLLNGYAWDPMRECDRYEGLVRSAGGLDLAVLGIGRNGHIAFNEPGSPLDSRTRIVRLTPETIQDNGFEWLAEASASPAVVLRSAESVGATGRSPLRHAKKKPSECRELDPYGVYALTMGIETILEAREIILQASGARKAGVVAQALLGSVTISLPASALQLHPNVTVILDREAAGEMDLPWSRMARSGAWARRIVPNGPGGESYEDRFRKN